MNDHGRAYWLLGLAVAGGMLLTAAVVCRRSHQVADPVSRANDLIARCNHKISQIEASLEHLQAAVQPAA